MSSLFKRRVQIGIGWGHDTFSMVSDFDLVVPILVMVDELICVSIKLDVCFTFLRQARNVISSVYLMFETLDRSQFWVSRGDNTISVIAKFHLIVPIFVVINVFISVGIKLDVSLVSGHKARYVISSIYLMFEALNWGQFWVLWSNDSLCVVLKFNLVIPIFEIVYILISVIFLSFGN